MNDSRFAPSARTALSRAFSVARQLCQTCIGSEHILLGLYGEDTPARRLLLEQGIDYRQLLSHLYQAPPGAVFARWCSARRARPSSNRPQ